jgi:hypothetical protein
MARPRKAPKKSFREMLEAYINIRGLDIIILLDDGREIELNKNRRLEDDEIVIIDKLMGERRIPIKEIKSVDLYAA